MAPKKNFHHHNRCIHHPQKRARGRCTVCGDWLCKECSLTVRGSYYCLSPRCIPDEVKTLVTQSAVGVSAEPSPSDPFVRVLIFRSAITIALCGVVFAAWALREAGKLHAENRMLRASRIALIEQLKSSNLEIDALTVPDTGGHAIGDTAPLPPAPPASARARGASSVSAPARNACPTNGNNPYHFVNGPVDRKTVALTFDGGSHANAAEAILDTLASRSVTATMFLTGEFIRKFPGITQRIVAAGHECGNHTFGHPHLTSYEPGYVRQTLPSITAATLTEELVRADRLFLAATGVRFHPLWRAPFGEFNSELCRWAFQAGYMHVGWRQGRTWRDGLDSNDWIPDPETPGYHIPQEVLDKIVALARRRPYGINGGIALFHLGSERRNTETQVHLILGGLIDTLRAEGYHIVPVSEMAASAGIDLASLRKRINIQ